MVLQRLTETRRKSSEDEAGMYTGRVQVVFKPRSLHSPSRHHSTNTEQLEVVDVRQKVTILQQKIGISQQKCAIQQKWQIYNKNVKYLWFRKCCYSYDLKSSFDIRKSQLCKILD